MTRITRYQVPSLALIVTGLALASRGSLRYAAYLADPPSHPIGLLAEFMFLAYLAVASLVAGIGLWGLRRDRPILPITVLVGIAALACTFAVDLYGISTNTQYVVALGLILSVAPSLAVGVLLNRTTFWTG